MRLKTFSAKTMQEAMAQVRKALGPDAIIVSSRDRDETGYVHVTAALETDAPPPHPDPAISQPKAPPPQARPAPRPRPQLIREPARDETMLQQLLDHHRLPRVVADQILKSANAIDAEEPVLALAAAFDGLLHFLPFEARPVRPLALIGLPGAGKTVTVAKLAAEAILDGRSAAIITADTLRAGAVEQIRTYAKLLEVIPASAKTPQDLAVAVTEAEAAGHDLVLIDTPGINPYDRDELATLQAMLDAVDGEPVLVAPAGMDAAEAHEFSMLFADLGCRRFIATRLDTARRFGSLLAFGQGGPLAIAGVSASPFIGDRIETLNPVSLARLIAATPKQRAGERRAPTAQNRVQS